MFGYENAASANGGGVFVCAVVSALSGGGRLPAARATGAARSDPTDMPMRSVARTEAFFCPHIEQSHLVISGGFRRASERHGTAMVRASVGRPVDLRLLLIARIGEIGAPRNGTIARRAMFGDRLGYHDVVIIQP
jgi:hypothetical protein